MAENDGELFEIVIMGEMERIELREDWDGPIWSERRRMMNDIRPRGSCMALMYERIRNIAAVRK